MRWARGPHKFVVRVFQCPEPASPPPSSPFLVSEISVWTYAQDISAAAISRSRARNPAGRVGIFKSQTNNSCGQICKRCAALEHCIRKHARVRAHGTTHAHMYTHEDTIICVHAYIHRCTSCTHEYMRVSTHACRAVHASMADARKRTCAEGSDRNCTITKNVRKVSGHDNNAFEWLESSIADANLPKTARTHFTTAESSIADANLPKTARTRFTTADTRPWS